MAKPGQSGVRAAMAPLIYALFHCQHNRFCCFWVDFSFLLLLLPLLFALVRTAWLRHGSGVCECVRFQRARACEEFNLNVRHQVGGMQHRTKSMVLSVPPKCYSLPLIHWCAIPLNYETMAKQWHLCSPSPPFVAQKTPPNLAPRGVRLEATALS